MRQFFYIANSIEKNDTRHSLLEFVRDIHMEFSEYVL